MERPNFLIVAGTGRNVGKTTFVCRIIEQTAKSKDVIAVKITPHFHAECETCTGIKETPDYRIAIEHGGPTQKDSAKMVEAGAKTVYYLQVKQGAMQEALDTLLPLLPNDTAVIFESAILIDYVNPALFVVLSNSNKATKNSERAKLADVHVVDYNYDISNFRYSNNRWTYSKNI